MFLKIQFMMTRFHQHIEKNGLDRKRSQRKMFIKNCIIFFSLSAKKILKNLFKLTRSNFTRY